MTLRACPELIAPQALSGLRWDPPSDAHARWSPDIRAASREDETSIDIYDVIDEYWGFSARRATAALRSIGDRDVTVNINSPGGSAFEGVAIYNALRAHPRRVTVQVMGLAASAASVIAMAADELRIAKSGFLMIHNAWGVVIGNRHDQRQAADMLEKLDAAMAAVYADRADIDAARAAELMDAETWLTGAEALELGLADAYLPADAVAEDPAARAETAAARTIERALMAAHPDMSRRERRSLMSSITVDRPGAVDPATPCAGDLAAVNRLLATLTKLTETGIKHMVMQ